MAATWPKNRRLLGTKVHRLDGPDKSTGHAKYSYDINRPGMLHATILRCPYAHAKIKSLDASAAERMPGVKAIHFIAGPGKELFYAGSEILGLAADTEEHVADALRAIKIVYDQLDHYVKEEDLVNDAGTPKQGVRKTVGGGNNAVPSDEEVVGEEGESDEDKQKNLEKAFKEADAVVEGHYGVPTISHQCLESHGLVAEWEKDGSLTVWCSTQATFGTAGQLAGHFGLPVTKVKCITHYMGGGFGSKFGPDIQGIVAAELARKAGRPVKLMLDREAEITTGGNRPSAYGKVKIAGKKDGTITAYQVEAYGCPGVRPGRTVGPLPYVYPIARSKVRFTSVRLNAQDQRAMRAPGHPQSCFLTECPIEDLAAKLGLDPMQVRLKNLPRDDAEAVKNAPTSINALRHTIYTKEIEIAAQLSDWKNKWHPAGADKGIVKHGIGMAIHTWGGAGGPNQDMRVTISSDGSVLLESSTQDLGTGERTVLATIIAEILGLDPHDITIRIGESQLGRSGGSGGSTTTPGTAPAVLNAVTTARTELLSKIAGRVGAKADDLMIEPGKIVDKTSNKDWSWKQACAKLGRDTVVGTGNWTAGLSNNGVGGVQIAEVTVDTETGQVRVHKVVAVQDCGLVVSKLTCESQVAGGVIMGLNYALFEERIMDRHTGRQVNPNMEFYKLAGIKDIPKIVIHLHDMPERGVIGIGEPPTISTAAAIGNAVQNAIGVRVPHAPFRPDRVLAALAAKGGKS